MGTTNALFVTSSGESAGRKPTRVYAASADRPIEGRFMVARMATYRFKVDANDLAKKAEAGLLPIFKNQPGFRDYSLFADRSEVQRGPRGLGAPHVRQVIAITLWDTLEEAQAGVAAAREWVDENMSNELEWTDTEFVDVLLSASFGISPS
jgi:heme-degrading monooxygenase HmoA